MVVFGLAREVSGKCRGKAMLAPERPGQVEPGLVGLRVDSGSQTEYAARTQKVVVLEVGDETGAESKCQEPEPPIGPATYKRSEP